MYSSPQFIHRTSPYRSYYEPYYQSQLSPVSSQTSVCYENEPNNASRIVGGYDSFANNVVTNECSSPMKKFASNMHFTNTLTGNYVQHELDCNNNNGNIFDYIDDKKITVSGNHSIVREPIYDDIKVTYEEIENIRMPQRCSTIIEEFYGEV